MEICFNNVKATRDLVVVSICDGVRVYASFLHLNQDSHSHDRKAPHTAELHHHSVAHLKAREIKT